MPSRIRRAYVYRRRSVDQRDANRFGSANLLTSPEPARTWPATMSPTQRDVGSRNESDGPNACSEPVWTHLPSVDVRP